jgi:hypothetical protein
MYAAGPHDQDHQVMRVPTHTVWAMSSRDMEGGFNDTMHIILSAVFSVLVVAAMALSGVAYRGWFRLYAFATIAVVVASEWQPLSRSGASSRTTRRGRAASSGSTPTHTSRGLWSSLSP